MEKTLRSKLAYIGKILTIEPIPNADFIVQATVVCGEGGKWRGVVRKIDFAEGDKCIVFLHDAIIPETPGLEFMKATNWRVKMRIFKGCPSECVIIPYKGPYEIGYDITEMWEVKKYIKAIPAHLQGVMKGDFPSFLPKTDEPNYQKCPELIEALRGHSYYVSEKADGSSTTAYKWKGNFGVCSRNLELNEDDKNGYWKVANKYRLKETLPEGYALQWETVGPKIQKNPMGFKEIDGLAFNLWNIKDQRAASMYEFLKFCKDIEFPRVRILKTGDCFEEMDLEELAKGRYSNGQPREGVVIRSQNLLLGNNPISFKSINLEYED